MSEEDKKNKEEMQRLLKALAEKQKQSKKEDEEDFFDDELNQLIVDIDQADNQKTPSEEPKAPSALDRFSGDAAARQTRLTQYSQELKQAKQAFSKGEISLKDYYKKQADIASRDMPSYEHILQFVENLKRNIGIIRPYFFPQGSEIKLPADTQAKVSDFIKNKEMYKKKAVAFLATQSPIKFPVNADLRDVVNTFSTLLKPVFRERFELSIRENAKFVAKLRQESDINDLKPYLGAVYEILRPVLGNQTQDEFVDSATKRMMMGEAQIIQSVMEAYDQLDLLEIYDVLDQVILTEEFVDSLMGVATDLNALVTNQELLEGSEDIILFAVNLLEDMKNKGEIYTYNSDDYGVSSDNVHSTLKSVFAKAVQAVNDNVKPEDRKKISKVFKMVKKLL